MPENLGYQFDRTYAAPIERYRVVSTIAERDAIPQSKRYEGMLCYVKGAENKDFQLRNGTSNLDWVEASQGNFFDLNNNDSDDITEGVANLFLNPSDQQKLDYITITQNIDLDALKSDLDSLSSGVTFIDEWDASGGSFPSGANTGYLYTVSVSGTVDGVSFSVGDGLIAKVDTASTTTFSGNWIKTESLSDVTSVVGLKGSIKKSSLLSALNVEDGATADMTGEEISNAITTYLTSADWQSKLTSQQVMDIVGDHIGVQSNIQVIYDLLGDNKLNFYVPYTKVVYANLTALTSQQGLHNVSMTLYEVTDASGFTGISSGRAWVWWKGTNNQDETDYVIMSAEEWGASSSTLSLQNVTDNGATTDNNMSISKATPTFTLINTSNFRSATYGSENVIFSRDGFNTIIQTPTLTGNYTLNLPDLTQNETIATESYVASNGFDPASDQTITGDWEFDNNSSNIIEFKSNGVLRSKIRNVGVQDWYLNNGITEVGSISFSTPENNTGLTFHTGATYDQNRFDVANAGTYFYIKPHSLLGSDKCLNIKTSNGFIGIFNSNPSTELDVTGVVNATSYTGDGSYLTGVVKKHTETIGDGTTTSFNINHGLGTSSLANILVRNISGGNLEEYDTLTIVDDNNITITFAVAPTTNQFEVITSG